MSDIQIHTCSCGYQWQHGQHGGHSCSDRLREALEQERADHAAKVRELEAEIRDLKSTASVVQVAMDCGSRLYEHSHRQLAAANERAEELDRDNATMHSLLSDIAVFAPQFGEKIRAVLGAK